MRTGRDDDRLVQVRRGGRPDQRPIGSGNRSDIVLNCRALGGWQRYRVYPAGDMGQGDRLPGALGQGPPKENRLLGWARI